jgi:PAT family beta-lactamase induction signal transducer AmpG
VVGLTALIAFLSATLDIVLDAYRRELLPEIELGIGNAIHVNAYKLAGLVPGSLSLVLADHLPWSQVFLVTALFMAPGLVMTLLVRSRPPQRRAPCATRWSSPSASSSAATAALGAGGAGLHLSLQAGRFPVHRAGHALLPGHGFLQDRDRPDRQERRPVAERDRRPAGGLWMVKLGINRALWVFGVVQWLAIFGFAWLAWLGPAEADAARLGVLAAVIGLEALGVGLGPPPSWPTWRAPPILPIPPPSWPCSPA